jgi:hypothetical protein
MSVGIDLCRLDVFRSGDFNYRVNIENKEVVKGFVESKDWPAYFLHDQLRNALKQGDVFVGR